MSVIEREYTALHEGLPPRRVWREPPPRVPRAVADFGRICAIQYTKEVTDGAYSYRHPFEDHAQPTFGLDRRGRIWIYEGRYVVTSHGIEDLPRLKVRRERLPRTPRSRLITLGKLEWIKYKKELDGVVTTGLLEFKGKSRPDLVHDERGNLFVLNGHYTVRSEQEGDSHMARKRRQRRRHTVARANPSMKGFASKASRVAISGVVTGAAIVAAQYGLGMLMQRAAPRLSNKARAAATAGVGLATGVALEVAGAPSVLAVAAAAGGVASGISQAILIYQAERTASQGTSGTSGTTNPSQRVLASGFSGIPANFNVVNGRYVAR